MKIKIAILSLLFLLPGLLFAETGDPDSLNFYKKDPVLDGVEGTSVEKAYKELPLKFDGEKVLVAIIDDGVDIQHEELKDRIWTNEDEIPDNGKDDDGNGYVDDVHGWNFLGGKDGRSITGETLELTRLARKYRDNKGGSSLTPDEEAFLKDVYTEWERQMTTPKVIMDVLQPLYEQIEAAKKELTEKYGVTDFSKDSLNEFKAPDNHAYLLRQQIRIPRDFLLNENAPAFYGFYSGENNYHFNIDLDVRQDIVGDNPDDLNDTDYGNNLVLGGDGGHGTYVTGIAAANRTNGIGIMGVTDHVIIMPVTVVPDGDERDKDVALAIRYAVDNGAQVINMSFGKAYSPHKKWVDDAVRYAEENGVLLVHASGNDGQDIDEIYNYPMPFPEGGGERFSNYLSVGASQQTADENLIAAFSNYGKKTVDLFAPGNPLHSLGVGNEYRTAGGTSASAPVVTGICALILSQFPDLEPDEVIEVLRKTARQYPGLMVIRPGTEDEKVAFSELSISGGVIDAYAALKYLFDE